MQGSFIINGNDMFDRFGLFLAEKSQGDFFNLSELLKPANMKPYATISFREENGEKLPDVLPSPRLEARDFQLYVAMIAESAEVFAANYTAAMQLLQSGWLTMQCTMIARTLKVYYVGCTSYEPLTEMEGGEVVCRMKLKFREPQPTI